MSWGRGYPFAVLTVAAATAVLLPFRSFIAPVQVMLLYVPVIVWLARSVQVRATLTAATVAFLTVDLLFIPPYYRLSVTSPVDWVTLVLFLGVAVAAGLQTGRMRERETDALRRQDEIALLNRLSARLVSEDSVDAMASSIVADLVGVGVERAALYLDDATGGLAPAVSAGAPARAHDESVLAEWVARNDKAIALPPADGVGHDLRPISVPASEAVEGVVADGVFVPLQTGGGLEGVLYARLPAGPTRSEAARLVLAVSNLVAAFLERHRLEDKAARATALAESDRFKATLVSSVSHELKTPLAAVTARVTGLLEEGDGCDSARVHSELEAVSEDLDRLDSSIRDLLDVSRLESDAWRPHFESYEVGEVLGTVAAKVSAPQRSRIVFDVPAGLPPVSVDFAQIARAVSNLVENALAYAPEGTPVLVSARKLGAEVLISVEDRGPGVPEVERLSVFDKFFRGSASGLSPSGTGLGLAIVREIVKSHGGRVWVEPADEKGARFTIALPVQAEA